MTIVLIWSFWYKENRWFFTMSEAHFMRRPQVRRKGKRARCDVTVNFPLHEMWVSNARSEFPMHATKNPAFWSRAIYPLKPISTQDRHVHLFSSLETITPDYANSSLHKQMICFERAKISKGQLLVTIFLLVSRSVDDIVPYTIESYQSLHMWGIRRSGDSLK